MKISSSILCASAIATSTLIAFSTPDIAISQPRNVTTSLELGDTLSYTASRPMPVCRRLTSNCGWW